MMRRAGVAGLVAGVLAAAPAGASAAPVPFEADWLRAAADARVAATPAPSDLAGFAPIGRAPGGNASGINGAYRERTGAIGKCKRWRDQRVSGFLQRPASGASLTFHYYRLPRSRGCRPPLTSGRARALLGHIEALGTRMALYRLPEFEPSQTAYAVVGHRRGWRIEMTVVHRGSVPRDETVRLAQGLRWVRRPPPCIPDPLPQHRLERARELMSQERHTTFSFPASPRLGVYVHEIFIAAKTLDIEGNFAGDVLATVGKVINRFPGSQIVVFGKGDNREPARDFDPTRVRAFAVLDFVRGTGYLVANHTTVRIQAKLKPVLGRTLTKTLYNRSFTARDVIAEWQGGNNWVDAAWVTPDTFRLRYGLRASGPGGTLIMNTIDHQLLIDRRSGRVAFEGDRFPSTGTYRIDCDSKTHTMHRQAEAEVGNLGDDPVFSHDAPVTGVQPGTD